MKNKKSLFEIQVALQDAIMNRRLPNELAHEISEKPPISSQRRLEIYQDAYEIRLVESLRDDFPSVEEKMHEEEFEVLAIEFLKLHPSIYRNLAAVSQHFPEFLKTKSNILFEAAVQDWLRVLSNYEADPEENMIVSAEAIQHGETFHLKKHPATHICITNSHIYLGYRYLWESQVVDISEKEMQLLVFLESPRTLEEFSNKSFELGLSETELSQLLSQWMKNEVIFCERTLP